MGTTPHLAVLLIISAATVVKGLTEGIVAEGNPYDASAQPACCPAQAMPPHAFLMDELALSRQEDTFVHVRQRKHLGKAVHVFTFKQPHRLSEQELPFDLVLVRGEIPSEGIVEIPAPAPESSDSWFPDYTWSHFVICSTGDRPHHLGWRFSRKASARGAGPDSFVALIVRPIQKEVEVEVQGSLPLQVPVSGRVSVTNEEDASPSVLPIGVEAPAWMLKMLAALSARAAHSRTY